MNENVVMLTEETVKRWKLWWLHYRGLNQGAGITVARIKLVMLQNMLRVSEHGIEVTELMKGKEEQGTWVGWSKEDNSSLSKWPEQQGWRSKAERDPSSDKNMLFWALFGMKAVRTLIMHLIKHWQQLSFIFLPFLLLRNASGYLWETLAGLGTMYHNPIPAYYEQALSKSWNMAFHKATCECLWTFLCV